MVKVEYTLIFKKKIKKLDNSFKIKVKKQIEKIVENPLIGKPMKYERKGTRELYLNSFRIAYSYNDKELIILFLDIYHKNKQ